MTRIIFVNRYFFPDHSATSQILSDLAFALAAAGRSVAVVTSQQRYDDPHADLPRRATERGVEIHRMSTTRFGRTGLAGRSLSRADHALARLLRPGDVLVTKTDPAALRDRHAGGAADGSEARQMAKTPVRGHVNPLYGFRNQTDRGLCNVIAG